MVLERILAEQSLDCDAYHAAENQAADIKKYYFILIVLIGGFRGEIEYGFG
jgi:hypothetical protein